MQPAKPVGQHTFSINFTTEPWGGIVGDRQEKTSWLSSLSRLATVQQWERNSNLPVCSAVCYFIKKKKVTIKKILKIRWWWWSRTKMFIPFPVAFDLICVQGTGALNSAQSAHFYYYLQNLHTVWWISEWEWISPLNSRSVIFFFFSPLCCLQRSIDDKFCCVEEREGQVRRLQLALREKERDLERLRCILSSNEETITVYSWHTARRYSQPIF